MQECRANNTLLGIRFAPLAVPLRRRVQTFCILLYALFLFPFPQICTLFIGWQLIVPLSPLFFPAWLYVLWIIYDNSIKKTSSRGGRRFLWVRNSVLWKNFAQYFPVTLHKTTEIVKTKNYIFGYHPHGILGYGAFVTFASEGVGFSKIFPGITPHVHTLIMNFRVPIVRDILLALGMCDVSKDSIRYVMTKKEGGNASIVLIGGAAETLEAHPGTFNLCLKERKGFVKMAIKTGASLVPTFSFGENELFSQVTNPEGSFLRRLQTLFKRLTGVAPALFHGRGVFVYNVGFLPYRQPINIIVGKPIDTIYNKSPSEEYVSEVHKSYMEELNLIFEKYKVQFGIKEETKLTFK